MDKLIGMPVPQVMSLKVWPEHFEAVRSGAKKFEIRRADRDYRVGQTLVLREWAPEERDFTGRHIRVEVTHLLPGSVHRRDLMGIRPGYVALSIQATGGEA